MVVDRICGICRVKVYSRVRGEWWDIEVVAVAGMLYSVLFDSRPHGMCEVAQRLQCDLREVALRRDEDRAHVDNSKHEWPVNHAQVGRLSFTHVKV